MYVESIKFKREENSKWENGYYIGQYENCDNSTILDKHYKPIPKEEGIWDVCFNLDNPIKLMLPEEEQV